MAKQIFAANKLTGGVAGALDDINHTAIEDGNIAIVIDASSNNTYFFKYDSSEAGAESSPTIIIPDSNTSGTGAWVLEDVYSYDLTVGNDLNVLNDADIDGDLNVDGAAVIDGAVTAASLELGGSGAVPTEFSTDGTMAGNSDTAIPTEQAVVEYTYLVANRPNLLINPEFTINQRAAVSGASIDTGDYFLDRWCGATDASEPTWSGSTMTIPAGDSVKQIVEAFNIPNGTYTISWSGSSTLSIDGGASQTSPHTFTVSSGSDVEIEFEPGTLSSPMLVQGSVAMPFVRRTIGEELAMCHRYYWTNLSTIYGTIYSTDSMVYAPFPVTMRATPDITATLRGSITATYVDAYKVQLKDGDYTETYATAGNIVADAEL